MRKRVARSGAKPAAPVPGALVPEGGPRFTTQAAGWLAGKKWSGYLMATPLMLLVTALLLLPIGTFLLYSFLTPAPFRVGLPFTLENYRLAFTDPIYWRLMLNSVRIGLTTAAVSTVLGYALAYYASFCAGKAKMVILALTVVSILGGYLVRIYAWRIVLGTEGVLNSALGALGLSHNPLQFLLFSRSAVVVALVNIYIPFTALTVFASLENVGRDLIEAARDLGAGPLRAFGRVVLPLTGRAMLRSSAIHMDGTDNRIVAVCEGSTLTLSANGEVIAQVDDDVLDKGDVGMAAGTVSAGGATVWLDDFEAREP